MADQTVALGGPQREGDVNRTDFNRRVRCVVRRAVPGPARTEVAPISIIVPARNVEATVHRTIESVLAQTSDRWEMIIVDDGSTDRTAEIVDAMVGDRPNVTVVEGPGTGVSAARNFGTELARFDHVLFLDADDWIDTRMVELMGAALADDPTLAGARCIWAYETADGRTQAWDDLLVADLFAVAARRCPFAIHACVVRRDLVRAIGGFDPKLVVGEDWDLWQRVGRAGGRLAFVPEVMAYYFMRPESVMHLDHERSHRDLVEVTMRGARRDDRVPNPLPHYREGLPLDPMIDVEAETLAGTLAVAVPTGVDLASLLPDHGPDPTKRGVPAATIAGILHETVAFGSCALLSDWLDLYVRWESRMRHMLRIYTDWLGEPELVEPVLRQLELQIAKSVHFDDRVAVGRTVAQRVDLRDPLSDIHFEPEIVQFVGGVHFGDTPIGMVAVPVVKGLVSRDWLAESISRRLGSRLATRALGDVRLAAKLVRQVVSARWMKAATRALLDVPWEKSSGTRDAAEQFLRWSGRHATASLLDVSIEVEPRSRAKPAEFHAHAEGASDVTTEDEPRVDPDRRSFDDVYGEDYFNSIFEEDNPWLYTGDYEQTKYEQTLAVIGEQRIGRALELACAEGHFTVQLAPLVDELIAADISPIALERAEQRCRRHGFDDIEFRRIDLRSDELPGNLDLIVCSEVLYFMDDEAALADLARRFAGALRVGGRLVMAHANLIVDDPDKTGFEWGHEFGARRIGEIVADVDGLRMVSICTSDLYRIHLLERVEPGSACPAPDELDIPLADNLDTHIRRMALMGGAVTSRAEAMATEVSYQVPILMYHRVAPTGVQALDAYRVTPETFERQLEYLRTHGYYGITFDTLQYSLAAHRPLPGRAVLITFDDGYQDFFDHAWPLLRDYDFPATVFVVADGVGTAATWDARYGEPAPLMDWHTLRYLQANGIEIASHTATHLDMTLLDARELIDQERRCRAVFREQLGVDPVALAYPFGQHDEVVETAARAAGYEMAVTTRGGLTTVWHDPMLLPRVDIDDNDLAESFERKLGRRGVLNPVRRTVRRVRALR